MALISRSHSEQLSSVDTAWLRMDSPTNLAVITGIFMFDQPIPMRVIEKIIEERFLIFRRFRQRVVFSSLPLGLPRWEDDPHFDLRSHLHRIALPAPGDQAALEALAGDLMSTPLDSHKPLWQMYLVENFGTGCALVSRLHHAIADGIALMEVIFSLTDQPGSFESKPAKLHSHRLGLVERVVRRTTAPLVATYRVADALLQDGLTSLISPQRVMKQVSFAYDLTKAAGKLLLIGPDSKSVLKGNCGVPKRAAWSTPISLEEVKAVGRAMDSTVNDVLLSAVTGGLRHYMLRRQGRIHAMDIRAMVPVNLRPPKDAGKLGNRFGLVFLSLPVGLRDPVQRLKVLKNRMDDIKNSPEAIVAFGILGGMGLTPIQIEKIICGIFGMKGTAVMTNVPGPRQAVSMAGNPVKRIMFWVPHPANLGMGVSIFSYNGEVIVGIATDAGLVPDPENVVAEFQGEWKRMRDSVPALCQGYTKEGEHCKNRALAGGAFCKTHMPNQLPAPRKTRKPAPAAAQDLIPASGPAIISDLAAADSIPMMESVAAAGSSAAVKKTRARR